MEVIIPTWTIVEVSVFLGLFKVNIWDNYFLMDLYSNYILYIRNIYSQFNFNITDYTKTENFECDPSPNFNYATLTEARTDCSKNVFCNMVFRSCNASTTFKTCPYSSHKLGSSCGSVLYQKSEYKIVFIFFVNKIFKFSLISKNISII